MTNEEAKDWLKAIDEKYIHGGDEGFDAKRKEAISMAIKALSEQRTGHWRHYRKVKGFSSAYPNVCNLKIFPNSDKTWITIRDDVGTSITINLSDLELAISIIKAESEG